MTSKERDEAMSWCHKNKIIINVEPVDNNNVVIVINYKGKTPIIGTKIYPSKNPKRKDDKWWVEVYKLYKAYYDKNNKKTI